MTERPIVDFTVHGPWPVPLSLGGTAINIDAFKSTFWRKAATTKLAKERGCYVYAIRSRGGGVVPWYVGMTMRSFDVECTTDANMTRLANNLVHRAGTLLLFVVKYNQQTPGAPNKTAIGDLETMLISSAYNRNHELLNKNDRGVRKPILRIEGVYNAKQGQPSKVARTFRQALGL